MTANWIWIYYLTTIFISIQSSPINNNEKEIKKTEKLKSTDTLSNSGLDNIKTALTDDEPKNSKELNNDNEFSLPITNQKKYELNKVVADEIDDDLRRNLKFHPYYGYSDERHKRSKDAKSQKEIATPYISTSNIDLNSKPSSPVSLEKSNKESDSSQPLAYSLNLKRSVPYYEEPRFKRGLNLNNEEFLELLAAIENNRQNQGLLKNYMNKNYGSYNDDSNMINIDDEDPRAYIAQQYLTNEPTYNSDLGYQHGKSNYYDQIINQYKPHYNDNGLQYGVPQYVEPYTQNIYYPEKRFMVSRKRSQNYETGSYGNRLKENSPLFGYSAYPFHY